METRVLIVVLIALLFWVAPQPNSSEAQVGQGPVPVARVAVDPTSVIIAPYVKPIQHGK